MRNEGWFCHFLGLPCYAYGFRYGKIATRKKPIDRLDPNPLLSPNHPSTDDACEPPPQMKSAETQRRLREQMKRLAEEKAANTMEATQAAPAVDAAMTTVAAAQMDPNDPRSKVIAAQQTDLIIILKISYPM